MTYVVCQTGRCSQTYPMEYFGVITKDTKDVNCEKCGGVLIDSDGRSYFSRNAAVIPCISSEDLKKQRDADLKDKREQLKELQKDIKELEEDDY